MYINCLNTVVSLPSFPLFTPRYAKQAPVYDGREFLNSVEELQRQYVESMRMQVELKELQEQWKLESSHSLGESLRMLDVRWAGGVSWVGLSFVLCTLVFEVG